MLRSTLSPSRGSRSCLWVRLALRLVRAVCKVALRLVPRVVGPRNKVEGSARCRLPFKAKAKLQDVAFEAQGPTEECNDECLDVDAGCALVTQRSGERLSEMVSPSVRSAPTPCGMRTVWQAGSSTITNGRQRDQRAQSDKEDTGFVIARIACRYRITVGSSTVTRIIQKPRQTLRVQPTTRRISACLIAHSKFNIALTWHKA